MQKRPEATIKGMFVNSHVRVLREREGSTAVGELGRRFGGTIHFRPLEDVPVRDEVRIIEIVLDLMGEHGLTGAARAEAAGRLHFTNFSHTSLGTALLGALPHTPKSFLTLISNAPLIARNVFSNTNFDAEVRRDSVVISVDNCDYPPEHFAGFFGEWMRAWELEEARVRTRAPGEGAYEYWLYFHR